MFDRVYLHGAHLHSLKCHFPNSLASNMSMEVHVTQGFMNAVLLRGYGDLTHLSYEEVPIPVPAAGELLVKTIAVSVNPIDWKLRRGDLKVSVPFFPSGMKSA